MNGEKLPPNIPALKGLLQSDPSDWQTRRNLAHALYDANAFEEAAETIWKAPQIPNTDIELAFSAKILSKSQPRKAIRLLTAVLAMNRGKAVQNMGMANALLHHGLVLQAVRFYGAALESDPTLANPELEHFALWTDDEMRLYGDFSNRSPQLGDLPWMLRDPKEALKLTTRVSLHTTPIYVPRLPSAPGEQLNHQIYQQEAAKNAKITPPPSVTIPIDRVDPKHRRFDERYGAVSAIKPNENGANPPVSDPKVSIPLTPVPLAQSMPSHIQPIPHAAPDTSEVESSSDLGSGPIVTNQVPVQHSPAIPSPTATRPLIKASAAVGSPTRRLITPGGKLTPVPAVASPTKLIIPKK